MDGKHTVYIPATLLIFFSIFDGGPNEDTPLYARLWLILSSEIVIVAMWVEERYWMGIKAKVNE